MAVGDVDVRITKTRAFNCNVFDGVDDYVEIPHNAAQLGANLLNGFTISAWANPRSYGETDGRILDKSNAGTITTAGFCFGMRSVNNAFKVRIDAGTERYSASNAAVFGTWQHILVTVSSAQLATFYRNGVLSGTANQDLVKGIATITSTSPPHIGNNSLATDRTWDGSIRSVKMWNRVLTSAEIAADYAGSNIGTSTNGLIHNFKLGGDYADYGSVGVTATNSGSVPFVVDDNIAVEVKAQRVLGTATGKYLITNSIGGQVVTTAITD